MRERWGRGQRESVCVCVCPKGANKKVTFKVNETNSQQKNHQIFFKSMSARARHVEKLWFHKPNLFDASHWV